MRTGTYGRAYIQAAAWGRAVIYFLFNFCEAPRLFPVFSRTCPLRHYLAWVIIPTASSVKRPFVTQPRPRGTITTYRTYFAYRYTVRTREGGVVQ